MSKGEEELALHIRAARLPAPVREHRFHDTRRWRFDFAWPEHKIAMEVEGAVWTRGRHTRGSGFVKDMEKYNEAMLLGWTVLRVSTEMVKTGHALRLLHRLFSIRGKANE